MTLYSTICSQAAGKRVVVLGPLKHLHTAAISVLYGGARGPVQDKKQPIDGIIQGFDNNSILEIQHFFPNLNDGVHTTRICRVLKRPSSYFLYDESAYELEDEAYP